MTSLAVGLAAVLALGACTSNPSVKAVAQDIVQSIGLEPDEETCMMAALDDYTDAELEAIGEANETVDFSQPDAVETQGNAELQRFFDDLHRCMGEA